MKKMILGSLLLWLLSSCAHWHHGSCCDGAKSGEKTPCSDSGSGEGKCGSGGCKP